MAHQELAHQTVLSSTENLNQRPKLSIPNLGIGIWDGNFLVDAEKIVLSHLESTGITMANVAEFLVKLKLNYFERNATSAGTFDSIPEYLQFGGLAEYVKTSTAEFLTKHNVAQELQNYFIEPLMIHIYDQGLDIQPFTSLTSLTGLLTTGMYLYTFIFFNIRCLFQLHLHLIASTNSSNIFIII